MGQEDISITIFVFFTYYFIIKKFKIIPRFYQRIFNVKKILKLLNINLNIFIRTILLTFAFLWITYLGSTLGEEYIAVNSILIQLIIIASFFLDSYAFSIEGIIGLAGFWSTAPPLMFFCNNSGSYKNKFVNSYR